MKKIKLLSILFIFFPLGCNNDEDSINSPIDLLIDSYTNIPVKINTENSYTFTINAKDYTYSTEDNLSFFSDSLVVTITLTKAYSANSSVKLFDQMNEEILSESLNESKVVVNTKLDGNIPEKIKIDLVNFTGQFTIVVALDET